MPERTLTKQQAWQAHTLLDSLDPDECAEAGVLESVIWNRKELEPHASNFEQQRQSVLAGQVQTDGDDVREVEQGEQVHPLEANLGVHLTAEDEEQYAAIAEDLNKVQSEEVTVTLATESAADLREIDLADTLEVSGDVEQSTLLDEWAFMLDVDL